MIMPSLHTLNRWQAALIHLGISAVLFVAMLLVIVFYWYPGIFINMGGWHGITIVAIVDLVLGPLLTLIVFNTTKKSLRRDLATIAVLQIAALSYGLWNIESQRPLSQLLFRDAVYIITKQDYKDHGTVAGFFDQFPGPHPKLVQVDLPANKRAINHTLVEAFKNGEILEYNTQRYISAYQQHQEQVIWTLNTWSKLDTDKNCYWLNILSGHFKGQGCYTPNRGLAAISKEK